MPIMRQPKANLGQTTTHETLRGRGMDRTQLFERKPKESSNGESLGAELQSIYTTIHKGCAMLSIGLLSESVPLMNSDESGRKWRHVR